MKKSIKENKQWSSLIDILQWHAENQPDKIGYTYLSNGENEEINLTYGELAVSARKIASHIHLHRGNGQPVLLFFPPGLDFIKAFFGCLVAGAIAIPTPLPKLNKPDVRVNAILKDVDVRIILTNREIQSRMREKTLMFYNLDSLEWIVSDALDDQPAGQDTLVSIEKNTPAFLQYTSGSTSVPRGVLISHGNIIHNLFQIYTAFGHNASSRGVIWLPPYHDMGLIGGILQPLYSGFPVVLMSPFDFVQKPVRWLNAITRYRATTSGGPNFAYDLCVKNIPDEQKQHLDLSSWDIAFNGAEPINSEVINRFDESFKSCGFNRKAFYPCYGLAEATLFVSGGLKLRGPEIHYISKSALSRNKVVPAAPEVSGNLSESAGDWYGIVGCGQTLAGQTVVIVNPETFARCALDEIGEIWIRGESVAGGYWNKPEINAITFQAKIKDTGEGPFLRSGDLGFLSGHQLYITGRIKDLIIYQGRNYYPQDIELAAGDSHPALQSSATAAFSADIDGQEHLVIVQELKINNDPVDFEAIAISMRRAVTEHYEIPVHTIVFVRFLTIPRTTSGKIQRFRCRELFLHNGLKILSTSVHSAPGIEQLPLEDPALLEYLKTGKDPSDIMPYICGYLRKQLAGVLHIPEAHIDNQTSIISLGADSVTALELKNSLENLFTINIPVTDILQGAAIEDLGRMILKACQSGTLAGKKEDTDSPSMDHGEYPLSHGQETLWFLNQLAPESPAYNVPCAVKIVSELNGEALQTAFRKLVQRHAILRTTFTYSSGTKKLVQKVHDTLDPEYRIVHTDGLSDDALYNRIGQEARRPFNLETGPLMRIHLFQKNPSETVLLMVMHHIITDFWSLSIMIEELGELYAAECAPGKESFISRKAGNYAGYVKWQQNRLASGGDKLRSCWLRELEGVSPVLNLPTDFPRPPVQTYNGQVYSVYLDTGLSARIREFARNNNVTMHTLLLSAFQLLIFRYTRQEDFLIGIPTTGRTDRKFAGSLGYFVNPVVVRARPEPGCTFLEFLVQVKEAFLRSMAGQDYPFNLLVNELKPERDLSRSPLFQVMFAYQRAFKSHEKGLTAFALNIPGASMELAGLKLESFVLDFRVAQFDLTLSMGEAAERLVASFEFNQELYSKDTIMRMCRHLETLLEGIVINPSMPLAELPLIPQAEKEKLLVEWNGSTDNHNADKTVGMLFDEQAARTPAGIAIQYKEDMITYEELFHKSNQLAAWLRAKGTGPETITAIFMEHSIEMLVGILGVLKSGGAYLPVDPAWPGERFLFVLAETKTPLILTTNYLKPQLEKLGTEVEVFAIDGDFDSISRGEVNATPPRDAQPENLACIIYTSGSTGNPKGVMLTHKGITNLIQSFILTYKPGSHDKILPLTSPASASFIGEVLPILCAGGVLVLSRPGEYLDTENLFSLIAEKNVTIISTVPAFIAGLNHGKRDLPGLRLILSGGEALYIDDIDTLLSSVSIVNSYGLTETSVCSTFYPIKGNNAHYKAGVPLGRPIINTKIYVLGDNMELMPCGCAGEIYIGGYGLARGYFNNHGLTAERFIPDPFNPGEKLFKTGDLGAWMPGGVLKYLGRKDLQVKIRGYRVELGEIETALRKHPGIRDCVVVFKKDHPGNKRLVAYFVADGNGLSNSDLHQWLVQKIPFYMIPSAFKEIGAIPLNLNGKVDLAALPEPPVFRPVLNTAYLAPENELEQKILGIWQDILKIEKIGMNDNFFELGGNSLLISQAHQRIKLEFKHDVSLVEMFQYPTIRLCARGISRKDSQKNMFTEIQEEAKRYKALRNQRSALLKKKLSNIYR